MSKLRSFVEFLKVFLSMSKSDWREMDHKLLRIGAGVAGLIFWAVIALYFFRGGLFG
jgi:hypothetical protein